MSEQAEETQVIEETEIEETAEFKADDSEEVEIVLEGEEKPTSESVPLGKHLKRVKKLTGRVDQANSEADEERRKNKLLAEENRLLKVRLSGESKEPTLEDFDTEEQFAQAKRKWDQDQIDKLVDRKVEARLTERQQNSVVESQNQVMTGKLTEHYQRAESLNIKGYEEAEDIAIEALGQDAAKHIMANSEKSELIMVHLGKNRAKAEALGDLIRSNPVKGLIELGKLESKLQIKPRQSNASNPETELKGGSNAGENWQRKIDKMREQGVSVNEIIEVKKQAREAGANIF